MDSHLAQIGVSRCIALTLSHSAAVPFAIADTDLIATLSERIARKFAKEARIAVMPLPFDLAPYPVVLVQSRARSSDLAMRWLVALILREASSL